jgi:hypothetical protein
VGLILSPKKVNYSSTKIRQTLPTQVTKQIGQDRVKKKLRMIYNNEIENKLIFAYTLLISMINNAEPHHEKTMYSTGSISSVANKVHAKTKTIIHYKYYCEFYTQILTPIHCCSICFLGPVPTLHGIVTASCNLK